MNFFFSRLSAFGLLGMVLMLAGCSSTPAPTINTSAPSTSPTNTEVARFHVGESVSIVFSGTPDPTEFPPHEEQIKEDGTINLPLIGSVKALGKTAGELQSDIQNAYVPKYYVRLNVVVKAGDLIYYVRGEVRVAGPQRYLGETTVTKAIASAGDFTDFASHTVLLTRANGGPVIRVDVNRASEDSTLDLQVYPGDQIVVPRRLF